MKVSAWKEIVRDGSIVPRCGALDVDVLVGIFVVVVSDIFGRGSGEGS